MDEPEPTRSLFEGTKPQKRLAGRAAKPEVCERSESLFTRIESTRFDFFLLACDSLNALMAGCLRGNFMRTAKKLLKRISPQSRSLFRTNQPIRVKIRNLLGRVGQSQARLRRNTDTYMLHTKPIETSFRKMKDEPRNTRVGARIKTLPFIEICPSRFRSRS